MYFFLCLSMKCPNAVFVISNEYWPIKTKMSNFFWLQKRSPLACRLVFPHNLKTLETPLNIKHTPINVKIDFCIFFCNLILETFNININLYYVILQNVYLERSKVQDLWLQRYRDEKIGVCGKGSISLHL